VGFKERAQCGVFFLALHAELFELVPGDCLAVGVVIVKNFDHIGRILQETGIQCVQFLLLGQVGDLPGIVFEELGELSHGDGAVLVIVEVVEVVAQFEVEVGGAGFGVGGHQVLDPLQSINRPRTILVNILHLLENPSVFRFFPFQEPEKVLEFTGIKFVIVVDIGC